MMHPIILVVWLIIVWLIGLNCRKIGRVLSCEWLGYVLAIISLLITVGSWMIIWISSGSYLSIVWTSHFVLGVLPVATWSIINAMDPKQKTAKRSNIITFLVLSLIPFMNQIVAIVMIFLAVLWAMENLKDFKPKR